jgi:hypothetical protein
MKGNNLFFAVACLALATLACNFLIGGNVVTEEPSSTSTSVPTVLLSDDFSSSGWGTGTDTDSSIEYVDNALQMIVYTPHWFVWSTPSAQTYQDVHAEVTVINHDTDATTAFGIICNKQDATDDFYYVTITPAGEYAIGKATDGQSDVFLTNNDRWAFSDAIPQNAATYRIGADCGGGRIALYVNGTQIVAVTDSSYTSGGVALLTWSGEEATNTSVSFDDFLLAQLP